MVPMCGKDGPAFRAPSSTLPGVEGIPGVMSTA